MKLKEYAEKIQKIAERYPDLLVVYAKDEEGNGFKEVYYEPSIGYFDEDLEEYSAYSNSVTTDEGVVLEKDCCNAVCVN